VSTQAYWDPSTNVEPRGFSLCSLRFGPPIHAHAAEVWPALWTAYLSRGTTVGPMPVTVLH
jgi:hypothetical protein